MHHDETKGPATRCDAAHLRWGVLKLGGRCWEGWGCVCGGGGGCQCTITGGWGAVLETLLFFSFLGDFFFFLGGGGGKDKGGALRGGYIKKG